MKDVMDFLSAALPWICSGLLLAIFLHRAPERKRIIKRTRITAPKEWLWECASVWRPERLSATTQVSDLRLECWQDWSSVPVLRKRRMMTKTDMKKSKCFLIITYFMLFMVLSACGNADFIGSSYKIGDNLTIEFQTFNTAQTQEIDLKSDDTVRFDVTRESGQIDISFGLKDASPDYEGKLVESNSFTVTVHEDGRYVLTVTGSEAKGSVELTKSEQK